MEEETGLVCEPGEELAPTSYTDGKGRPKVVRYWTMEARSGSFVAGSEVDEVRWLPVVEAAALLTYERDRGVLASLGGS